MKAGFSGHRTFLQVQDFGQFFPLYRDYGK
jgi:hypothetical protein